MLRTGSITSVERCKRCGREHTPEDIESTTGCCRVCFLGGTPAGLVECRSCRRLFPQFDNIANGLCVECQSRF